jgi:hypothetical protein
MEHSESESIITINQADLDEGFFVYYTTLKRIAMSVMRKFKHEILSYKTTSRGDKVTSWTFQLTKDSLPKCPFLKNRRRNPASTLTQLQKDDLRVRLAKFKPN